METRPPSAAKPGAEPARQTREEAEAAALRANLARRKAQARAKAAPAKEAPECP
jgi:hypothetical protein